MPAASLPDDPSQYRLPTNVRPIHYELTMKTDLEGCTFQGLIKILLEIDSDTTKITLNSLALKLGYATLRTLKSGEQNTEQILDEPTVDSSEERITYKLTHPLKSGSKAELKITYTGEILGNMTGYYRSSWVNEGKTECYALTQFEPTSARRAFPCWDEPAIKAKYTISMISRAGLVNLSNMPVEFEKPIDAGSNVSLDLADISTSFSQEERWKITKFQTTPLMSSYLVALANGPFKFLEKSVVMPLSGKTLPLRIYGKSTPNLIHQAQYVLDVTVAVLPVYEKVFDVEYPLPKLDTLVASDFDFGAMENWGLITGRTTAMLLDPDRPDINAKKFIAACQSHEIAHMWFGNITTMEWWDNLYLNEGFATLMGNVIIPEIVFPEWRVNSGFITSQLSEALILDSKSSSHPVEVECPDANHVSQIFDSLSYSKAASVLRMLSVYVGQENFLKGVSIYLKNNLFSNTVTHDLWEGISSATALDITDLMDNWITKIGYPVLTVIEDPHGITVRQDRFFETGPASPEENETIWNIPLNILSIQSGEPVVDKSSLLREREKKFALDISKPFKLNAGTNGFYRVLYTPQRLALIAAQAVKEGSIFSLDDRIGLVHDSMALAKAGLSKIGSSLNLVEQFKNDNEFLVWEGISNGLADVRSIWWEHLQISDKLDKFCRALYAPLVTQLGYDYPEDETVDTALLRTHVIEKAFEAGDESIVEELRRRFKVYQDTGDDSNIPVNLQRVTYCAATINGDREAYEMVARIYDNPRTPTEQQSAILAMTSTQDETLLRETFEFISNKVKDQDILAFCTGLAKNYRARRHLAKFVRDEFDALHERCDGSFFFGYVVEQSLAFFSTKEDYAEIEDFFKDKDTSKYNMILAQAMDGIKARIGFIQRSTEDLQEWLSKC